MNQPLVVAAAEERDAEAWAHFVLESNDGTLYHELPFLAYHPPDRFRFEHLIVRQGATIVSVVPGGVVERDGGLAFVSPLGASVGGPLILRPHLAETISIVEALQAHARTRGWTALEFVLGPTAYQRLPADVTSFALFARGFRIIERDLTFIVPVQSGAVDGYATLFRKKQAWGVRAALRRGVTVSHGGEELLAPFIALFRETYERHGVAATHSEAEIADLLRRFPGRIEIAAAMREGVPLAAILVFRLNDRVGQTFYICSSSAHARENGTVAALSAVIDRLASTGARALDLGPSASSRRINEGVVFFKEGLGAAGQARDRWAWSVTG
ncbi:MAG TPA: GNAT family N-acetyltransferase [Candidatus Rubrimentiphilum sp.]|nr:GNAT family N-acetyltransferase [Candidatus Rubrimentiphilum sp.]